MSYDLEFDAADPFANTEDEHRLIEHAQSVDDRLLQFEEEFDYKMTGSLARLSKSEIADLIGDISDDVVPTVHYAPVLTPDETVEAIQFADLLEGFVGLSAPEAESTARTFAKKYSNGSALGEFESHQRRLCKSVASAGKLDQLIGSLRRFRELFPQTGETEEGFARLLNGLGDFVTRARQNA